MKFLALLATLTFALITSAEAIDVKKNKQTLAAFQADYLPEGSWVGTEGSSYTCTVDAKWSAPDKDGNVTLTLEITSTYLGDQKNYTSEGTYTFSPFDKIYVDGYAFDDNLYEQTLYKSTSLAEGIGRAENLSVVRNTETNELVDVSVSDLIWDGESDPSDNTMRCWDLKPKQ